jgi:hypothetical protein
MVKVELPRASWDVVLLLINFAETYGKNGYNLYKEIETQVYSQEY